MRPIWEESGLAVQLMTHEWSMTLMCGVMVRLMHDINVQGLMELNGKL